MAVKNNTITYVFEGDTLNLEQAIKRVRSLMRGTITALKEQEGGISNVQKAQYKQLHALMKTIKELSSKDGKLTENEMKKLNNAMKKALSISNSLYKAKLRAKDKIRRKAFERERKENNKNEKYVQELSEARTPEAQVRAHSQLQQLSRLRGFMRSDDPSEKEAIKNLDAVIQEYNDAKSAYDAGTGSMERLAKATVNLNSKYKELAGSLNRLSSEQNKANHGEGKSTFIQFLFGKTKSLAIYKLVKAVLSKVTQSISSAFAKIAKVNQPFNDAMSRITSSLQLLADKISTVLAPLIQLLTPMIEGIAQAVGYLSDKVAEMFSAIAGNDAWAQATYQVEDYADAVNKVSQPEGIDELNKLNDSDNNIVNVDIESKFAGLKVLGEKIQSLFSTVLTALGPSLKNVSEILSNVFVLVSSLATVLKPVFDLIVWIVNLLSGALNSVFGFLINNVLTPIVNTLAFMINHLEILIPLVVALIALFAATHWTTFVATLQSIWLGFINIGKAILIATKDLIVWIAKTIIAKAKSIAMAAANMWEAMTWWQKAIAIIAAGGVAAAVILGIVLSATASGNSAANETLNNDLGVTAAMATGGIVSAPTIALVGEGNYPEAVVPLGQSPQFQSMKEGIASEVASIIGDKNNSSSSSRPVILNIDGRTLAKELWPNLVKTQYQVGVKLI